MTTNDTKALKNRLSTIHRDLTTIVAATRHAAACVSNQRLTIKAASELHHTAENDKVAARLDRMTGDTTDICEFLRAKIHDVLLSYAYQRDRCSNSRRAFIEQGADVDQRIAVGMFDELESLIKAASGEAAVEGPSQKAEPVEPINTATALLAGDLCRLIEKRGLGGDLPLVSMLEDVKLLNPVARQVREDLFGMVEKKNGVSHEVVIALRRIIGQHCGGHSAQAKFIENWKDAHHKLNAIALGAKP